jgi:phosphatidylglycerol:prolipoprotein diacylglycerol transferase
LEGVEVRQMRRAMLAIALFAFAGGYLHYVLNQWSQFGVRSLTVLSLGSGSMHAPGAVLGVGLSAPFILRYFGLPVARTADALAPVLGIGIAVARIGCFLYGCCFGTPCNLPWCLSFPRGGYIYTHHVRLGLVASGAPQSAPVHPLQLYFAGAALLLTFAALVLYPRRRYAGQVALVFLTGFSASSGLLEMFRADHYPRVYWGPLPQLQWMALAMTVAFGGFLVAAGARRRGARVLAGR